MLFGHQRYTRNQLILRGLTLVIICSLLQFVNVFYFLSRTSPTISSHLHDHDLNTSKPERIMGTYERFRSTLTLDTQKSLLYGTFRNQTGYLTIGIPSVERFGVSYLEDTISSLLTKSPIADHRATIVILLADLDINTVKQRAKHLYLAFKNHVDSGSIHIIHTNGMDYPDFNKLDRNFGDTRPRVAWRSKQNIDYAYLFLYCRNISQYYLHLEDDVTAASNYIQEIESFIETLPHKWYCLHFSHLGFIGKLFHSSDLRDLAEFLLLFYGEQPGDMLFLHLKKIKTPGRDFLRKPSLFQHQGIISSLRFKKQRLIDKYFRDVKASKIDIPKVTKRNETIHNNPEAKILTSMTSYHNHQPEYAYTDKGDFFWAKLPKKGDFLSVLFKKPQNISNIFIMTGENDQTSDTLRVGTLKISEMSPDDKITNCNSLKPVGNFKKGVFDSSKLSLKFPPNIDCVWIEVTGEQKNWLIISEISIETNNK